MKKKSKFRARTESSHVGVVPVEFWDGTTEAVVVHVSAKTTRIINLNKKVAKNRHVQFPMFLEMAYNDLLVSAENHRRPYSLNRVDSQKFQESKIPDAARDGATQLVPV